MVQSALYVMCISLYSLYTLHSTYTRKYWSNRCGLTTGTYSLLGNFIVSEHHASRLILFSLFAPLSPPVEPPPPMPTMWCPSRHTHVRITLDLIACNFSKWRTLFVVTLGKYGLMHHVSQMVLAVANNIDGHNCKTVCDNYTDGSEELSVMRRLLWPLL